MTDVPQSHISTPRGTHDMNPRTRTLLDLEATVASLAASVTEIEADKTALKKQLAEAWAAADTARAQRDQALADCSRLFAHGSEALDQRDRARATAVAFEQELDLVHRKLGELRQHYTSDQPTSEAKAALDAVHDCAVCIATATDEVFGDLEEDGLDDDASERLKEITA